VNPKRLKNTGVGTLYLSQKMPFSFTNRSVPNSTKKLEVILNIYIKMSVGYTKNRILKLQTQKLLIKCW
jgi:hypothetical protein